MFPNSQWKTTATPATVMDPPSIQPHLPNPAKVLRVLNGHTTIHPSWSILWKFWGCHMGYSTYWQSQRVCPQKSRLAGSRTTFFAITWVLDQIIDAACLPKWWSIPWNNADLLDHAPHVFALTIMSIKTLMWNLYQDMISWYQCHACTNNYTECKILSARSNIWIWSENLAGYVMKYQNSYAVAPVPSPYNSSKKIAAHDHMTIPCEGVLIM